MQPKHSSKYPRSVTSATFRAPAGREWPALQPVNATADALEVGVAAESSEQRLSRVLTAQTAAHAGELIGYLAVVHWLTGSLQNLNYRLTPRRAHPLSSGIRH